MPVPAETALGMTALASARGSKEFPVKHEITVMAQANGWRLTCKALGQDEHLRSGADAEAAAHALGTRIAESGGKAVIRIFLRDGALVGHFVHAPQRRGAGPGSQPAAPAATSPAGR
jgi:hypothetical protein